MEYLETVFSNVEYIVIFAGVILFILIVAIVSVFGGIQVEDPKKRAGRQGERIVASVIREILREDDVLLNNIPIYVDGKQTELDNVIINSEGVFIIEVKNWRGVIIGDEDDYDWIQTKYSSGGEFYDKPVKNPIKQVDREIYLLASYLRGYGIDVWVEGYVFFLEMNAPIQSDRILETQRDIDKAIHRGAKRRLSQNEKLAIVDLLEGEG